MTRPRPTALGAKALLFYALIVGAFFSAPYFNLFFLLTLFLGVFGLLAATASFRALRGVSGVLEDPGPVPAGRPIDLRALVDGRGRVRPAACLVVEVSRRERIVAGRGEIRGEGRLPGRLPALSRGVHAVRAARVVTTWPFGLVESRAALAAPAELVVYPAPAELADARGGGGLGEILGAHGARGGLLQPSEIREYRPGDELRRVHWKASARRGDLVVTEWDGGGGGGLEAVLDRRTEPEALETALSLLAAIALAARDEKELVTLHSQGLTATYGGNHRPYGDLLRYLAEADVLPANAPAPPPASPEVLRLPAREGAR